MKAMFCTLSILSAIFAGCASTGNLNPTLLVAANELNKNFPLTIDSETRIDAVVVLSENRLRYIYTLMNYTNRDVDMTALRRTMEPILLESVKANDDFIEFRKKKITFEFYYRDKAGREAFLLSYPYSAYAK